MKYTNRVEFFDELFEIIRRRHNVMVPLKLVVQPVLYDWHELNLALMHNCSEYGRMWGPEEPLMEARFGSINVVVK